MFARFEVQAIPEVFCRTQCSRSGGNDQAIVIRAAVKVIKRRELRVFGAGKEERPEKADQAVVIAANMTGYALSQ